MAIELMKRKDGQIGRTFIVRGNWRPTAFDPIKDVTGYKDTVTFSGQKRPSVITGTPSGAATQPGATTFTAQSPPSAGPGSGTVARSLPSVPRRVYQPTVLRYP